MDYDRYDAFLHHIFKQTQGDAWFRPNEDTLSAGVALRINDIPEFRVFPYENIALEPFETAVAALNPVVAVKLRNAAVHAALADVPPEEKSIYVDANTRIQILDTMLLLNQADKEQCAAFIRDERVLIVWSESLDTIIPTCHDLEDRLIKLLWRSRPGLNPTTSTLNPSASTTHSALSSVSGHSMVHITSRPSNGGPRRARSSLHHDMSDAEKPQRKGTADSGLLDADGAEDKDAVDPDADPEEGGLRIKTTRTWYGRKVRRIVGGSASDKDGTFWDGVPEKRPARLFAPVYNGLAAGLAMVFMGNGIKTILQEFELDGSFIRFALCATLPLLYCVSLFFALQIVQNVTMAIGPIAQFHENSKYYSAVKPRPSKVVDNALPHVTIQMPVYRESLESVLTPSIESLKRAMQTYARQGGTSTIFVNDDGLRLLSNAERDRRIAYYANHNIGWVARPKHDGSADGFKRAGRFKKASNMNYALTLSLKAEKHLEVLQAQAPIGVAATRTSMSNSNSNSTGDMRGMGVKGGAPTQGEGTYGLQYQHRDIEGTTGVNTMEDGLEGEGGGGAEVPEVAPGDLEERALQMAIEEVYEESGKRWRPWAANGRSCRLGEIVLLVDSDTIVPEDCLRDAAREMRECPTVAIIQHESDVMQISHNYFENGLAYFTKRINRCISIMCANGEVAPFVGHNSFLRWQALQDAAFTDSDGQEKIWSETNVSEDFDMALRLQLRGYIIRWATYSKGGFKEGVSLTVDDELNRWQKYAYGCSELLFNPLVKWWRKGPIAHQIHRFMWSSAPLHYKISMMAYMFSYYGIAGSVTIGIINYVLLGFEFPVDGFYMHSFEIWLATTVVFFGSGTLGYTLLEYRLGKKELVRGFLENVMWIPFFFFFFGGLSIPISQAILAHLFSYNITWGATKKEVERSNFFKEVPKIFKRFWFPLLVSIAIIAGMVILSTNLVPYEWHVGGSAWAVIFPLAIVSGCHILFPIVLNPYLMVFSY